MLKSLCRLLAVSSLLLAIALPALGQSSPPLVLQLRLLDDSGQPISGGRFNARFSFYDADVSNDFPLFEIEATALSADNGLVVATLRLEDRINDFLPFDTPEELFAQRRAQVGVTITDGIVPDGLEVGEELFPRIPIAAVPYAALAGSALSISGATIEDLDQSAHVLDRNNPHEVTASQVGAPEAADVDAALATKADASHRHDELYYRRADVDQLIEALIDRIEALEAANGESSSAAMTRLVEALTVEGDTLRLDGVNLQLTSGVGATTPNSDFQNGLGNLILGYNAGADLDRSGTHNLVIGDGNSWVGSTGVVVGGGHSIGDRAVALGGASNTALAGSIALGGAQNSARQSSSVLIGGLLNEAPDGSEIEGDADPSDNVVIGGRGNRGVGSASVVIAGTGNGAPGLNAAVLGGANNEAPGTNAVVVGGFRNRAFGAAATTLGGAENSASGPESTVSGGRFNRARGENAGIFGGFDNETIGEQSAVFGGFSNLAEGNRTTIAGGQDVRLFEDDEVQDILAGIMTLDGDDLIFEGVNVHIRNGGGGTGARNGLGNLIVGYNEAAVGAAGLNGGTDGPIPGSGVTVGGTGTGSGGAPNPDGDPPPRTGSHNIVLGPAHEYTSFGAFLSGMGNTATAPGTVLLGGHDNEALWPRAALVGGARNVAGGTSPPPTTEIIRVGSGALGSVDVEVVPAAPTVVGGADNEAAARAGVVVGGGNNSVERPGGVVAGGSNRGNNP
ncbi:MAG: hypothetical protein AAGE01_23985 [Pseudomonadota bacterium]